MTANTLVQELLKIMTPSSEFGSDREWELTLSFVSECRDQNFAEIIYAATDSSTEPWKVGSLIDHLVWNIPDVALSQMMSTLELWLTSDERRRVSYALAVEYVFPFSNPEEMSNVMLDIGIKWPEFGARCDELIDRRLRTLLNKGEMDGTWSRN